jgi:hypothetical protein
MFPGHFFGGGGGVKLSVSYPTTNLGNGILLFVWVVTFDLSDMGDPASSHGTASISRRGNIFVLCIFYSLCNKLQGNTFVLCIFYSLCNKLQGNTFVLCIFYSLCNKLQGNIFMFCIFYSLCN